VLVCVCMCVCVSECVCVCVLAVAFKPAHLENKEKVLSETVACLKVLSACANHTSIQKGSSNDIILSRFFHVEEMCQVCMMSVHVCMYVCIHVYFLNSSCILES